MLSIDAERAATAVSNSSPALTASIPLPIHRLQADSVAFAAFGGGTEAAVKYRNELRFRPSSQPAANAVSANHSVPKVIRL